MHQLSVLGGCGVLVEMHARDLDTVQRRDTLFAAPHQSQRKVLCDDLQHVRTTGFGSDDIGIATAIGRGANRGARRWPMAYPSRERCITDERTLQSLSRSTIQVPNRTQSPSNASTGRLSIRSRAGISACIPIPLQHSTMQSVHCSSASSSSAPSPDRAERSMWISIPSCLYWVISRRLSICSIG